MIGRLAVALRRRSLASFDDTLRAGTAHWRRGAAFVLSFDVELAADCESIPHVLHELETRGIVASFACIGAWIDRYPDEHRAIVASGHEVLDHTDTHPSHDELDSPGRFDRLSDADLEREVGAARAKIASLGTETVGFRSPHFGAMHTERVYPILRRLGLRYSSSVTSWSAPHGSAPFDAGGITEFPLLGCPRHPGALLDSWHCTTAPDAQHSGMAVVPLYREALARIADAGAFASVYWDPRVVSLPGYPAVLDEIAAFGGQSRVARYVDLLPAP